MSAGIDRDTYTEDLNEIFGFRGYACNNCLAVGTLRVRFGEGKEGGRREDAHSCDPARVGLNKKSAGKSGSNSFLHIRLPHLVKERVSKWTLNEPFLVAIRLENPVEENLTFSSSSLQNRLITFQFSRENHFDIMVNSHNIENHRHILRAIRSRKTPLNDWELTNIIEMLKGCTFGTVTLYYKRPEVGLNKAPQPHHLASDLYFIYVTSYSALDKIKEGWQHDPIADFIASIKEYALFPGLFS
jgi:hypothetical protein